VKITISKENYLKAIAEAQAEGEPVIAATLARWLEVSPPAVTMAIRRLRRDGCIAVDAAGHITLTDEGRKISDRILHRHHLIERMLVEVFGMEWYKVHDEAERLEHAVSEDFERLLMKKLGADHPCAHGNDSELDSPLQRRERGWRTLAEVADSTPVTVVSVYERDRRLLEYLDGLSVQPGAKLEVVGRNYDETITFRIGSRHLQLGVAVARKVWVKPEWVPVGA
jgi:DtxR family Mn-dependent transcriptional regulator